MRPLDFQKSTLRLMSENLKVNLRDEIVRCNFTARHMMPIRQADNDLCTNVSMLEKKGEKDNLLS
jgi:hypothetical protein